MPACFWISSTSPAGLAKRLPRSVTTAPLGPASTRSTPASRQRRLIAMICKQVLDLGRQRAEAVDQLGGEGLALAPVGELGDAPVEPEPDAEIGDISFRDQDRRADRDLRAPLLGRAPSPSPPRRSWPRPPPLRACAGRARCRLRGYGRIARRPGDCRRRGCRGRGWRAGTRRRAYPASASLRGRRSAVGASCFFSGSVR